MYTIHTPYEREHKTHIVEIRMNTHEHEKQKKRTKIPVTECVDLKIKTMTNRSNNMQTKKAISLRVEFICVARINKQQQQTLENVIARIDCGERGKREIDTKKIENLAK